MTSRSKAFSRPAVWLALTLPLLLAACQMQQGPSHPGAAGPGSALARPSDSARGAASGGPLPAVADLAADPGRFEGLSGTDVAGLLGKPSFQRRDGDAEIWQYYGPSSACVLDLFVYPDGGQPRVAHAELRSRGAGGGNGCLAAILDGKRG
jgi:hypothetical protein